MTFHKSPHLPETQFLHLPNGNQITYLARLLQGLDEIMQGQKEIQLKA